MSDIKSLFQTLVSDFHKVLGVTEFDVNLRIKLIQEESNEFIDAVGDSDITEAIDALCDILYVTYGAADIFGLALDTSSSENITLFKGDIQWAKLKSELHDFTGCVGEVVAAMLENPTSLKTRNRLSDLANGCWKAGARGLGVDLAPFFLEVHRTNMNKINGPIREDGKRLKPPGWKPPRISAMYDRLQIKGPLICDGFCAIKDDEIRHSVIHADGGTTCGSCGGFHVYTETKLETDNYE